jgi:hypothetical protein
MKLFCLLNFLSLIVFSLQGCAYFKAFPKDLDSFFTDYKPYSIKTHFPKSETYLTNNQIDKQAPDITKMEYSDCKNICDKDGSCVIECLSFTQEDVITYYYYKIDNNGCTYDEMKNIFGLTEEKQCRFAHIEEGNYFEFWSNNGLKLKYNFRSGLFELIEDKGAKNVNVDIKLENNEYSISFSGETDFVIKGGNHFCFNALVEIMRDAQYKVKIVESSGVEENSPFREEGRKSEEAEKGYNEQGDDECDGINFQFSNKSENHNAPGPYFLDVFDFRFKEIKILEINKRMISLKVTYGQSITTNYYFAFNSHRCFIRFLDFINILICSSKVENNIYPFIFKTKDGIFRYNLDIKTSKATVLNSHNQQTQEFVFESLKIENNKVLFIGSENLIEFDGSVFKTCLLNLKKIENMAFTILKGPYFKGPSEVKGKGHISNISKNIIRYYLDGKPSKLKILDFKVMRFYSDNGEEYQYELHGKGKKKITLKTKLNFIEDLSISLCHIKKNEFYFKGGKIAIDDTFKRWTIEHFIGEGKPQKKTFDKPFLLVFSDSVMLSDPEKPNTKYHVYTDPICKTLLKDVQEKFVCSQGYNYVAKTQYLQMEKITIDYVNPGWRMENGVIKDNLLQIKGDKYVVLNFFNNGEVSLVELISKRPVKQNDFEVVKMWFYFDDRSDNNKKFCQSKFIDFVNSQKCDEKFYYAYTGENFRFTTGLLGFSGEKEVQIPIMGDENLNIYKYGKIKISDVENKAHKELSFKGSLVINGKPKKTRLFNILVPYPCQNYILRLQEQANGKNFGKKFIR